jgi:hypothetical protein
MRSSRRSRRSKDAKVELLGNVPLFSACSKRDLRRIAALVDEIEVPEGKVLIRQGEPGWECFVIAEGKAKATIRGVGSISLGDVPPRPGPAVRDRHRRDRHAPARARVTKLLDVDR